MTSALAPLFSSPGWELLQAWEKRPERRSTNPLALADALRSTGLAPQVASAVSAQLALRDAAEAKFGPLARRMFFTRDTLEQASRLAVAVRHAQRLRRAGTTFLADLGCGLGTESLAAGGLGMRVLAVDIDEDAAAAAAANLRDLPDAEVMRGDVLDLDIQDLAGRGVDALFADPARRTGSARGGARINDPQQWAPPLSTVLSWAEAVPALGVKVAPGIGHHAIRADLHAQWTSVDGDLVEAALWTPPLAPEGPGRSAQVIRDTVAHVIVDPTCTSPQAPVRPAPSGQVGAFLAEPDDAVIRAGLLALLCEDLGAHLVDPRIAYLTGEDLALGPFADVFEVIDVVPLRTKVIGATLRTLDVGHLEVKKRGADIDPAALRAGLRKYLDADSPVGAVVLATRIQGSHRAVVARRVQDVD
ncbi:SAM-dependent methyltransferase [Schaalia sp. 19OD2882]|uniref:THUMP-like domain-containing protein n=1 Tax=Schaalia sp. 19OD2882 TaxID=2794089 RepID=UPI001C1E9846|nr:methyltransferase domain-containing protein [Schaalia sp. 19OD2882]QWW19211.1 SAM-dependent methyltransferase [Schaalia sp. 19OD2882]